MKEFILGILILVGLFVIFRKKKVKKDEKDTVATGLELPPKPPKGTPS